MKTFIAIGIVAVVLATFPVACATATPAEKAAAGKAVLIKKAMPAAKTLSVVVERELPYSPEKIWGALTQPKLIAEWLMKNDFEPVVGHRFQLHADWGVVDCQVLAVEPKKKLSYTWSAYGLKTVVNWTLKPTSMGTRLRMEQSGFPPDQPQYYQGAKGGWPRFLASLEQVLARKV